MADRPRLSWGRVLVFAAIIATSALTTPTSYADEGDPTVVFRIRSDAVTESSSLVVSTTQDQLVYTTNDSGDAAVVYAIDTGSGRVVGRTTLTGVEADDFEALGGGADGSLVVADIGDNDAGRASVTVHRIEQPGRGDQSVTPESLTLRYVDGPRDAEAVLYDSKSGQVFVISKELGNAQVYSTGPRAFDNDSAMLRPVAAAPYVATDATYLPGGEHAVVRSYGNAAVLRTSDWGRVARFDLPPQEQGESIAAPSDGEVVWIGSEGTNAPVLAVSLPELSDDNGSTTSTEPTEESTEPSAPSAAEDPSSTAGDASPDDEVESAGRLALWIGGGAVAALVGVVVLLLTRSRRS